MVNDNRVSVLHLKCLYSLTIEIAVTGLANPIGSGDYRVAYHEKG